MLTLNQELKTVKNVDCLINTLKCTQLQFMKCFLFWKVKQTVGDFLIRELEKLSIY